MNGLQTTLADRLPPLADLLAGLAEAACADVAAGLELVEMAFELPIELDLIEEQGVWQIDAAPPTQRLQTTVMPVWHRLRARVSLDHGQRDLDRVES